MYQRTIFAFFAVLFVLLPQLAEALTPAVVLAEQQVGKVRDEQDELGLDLPTRFLSPARAREVQVQWRDMGKKIDEAHRAVAEPATAGKLLLEVERDLRIIAMLLPFGMIEDVKERDALMAQYMAMQDRIGELGRNYSNTGRTNAQLLKTSTGAWLPLSGKSDAPTALARCKEVSVVGYTDWRTPTLRELADAYPTLRNPTTNPAFGALAAKYAEVWTSDRSPVPESGYYVNFTTGAIEAVNRMVNFQVVCLGKIAK